MKQIGRNHRVWCANPLREESSDWAVCNEKKNNFRRSSFVLLQLRVNPMDEQLFSLYTWFTAARGGGDVASNFFSPNLASNLASWILAS
ncbi:unnamed protein product [Ilex paraguariensis]|uniref:Uncharacterized protein n=1 Tax=Ilex paraguariensis TaxID=185542 RepID=A0ABC8TFA7_9AQUA